MLARRRLACALLLPVLGCDGGALTGVGGAGGGGGAGSSGGPPRIEVDGTNDLMARGMNSAIALSGNYAYIGSRTDGSHANPGVLIVDISNPAAPRVVSSLGQGEASRGLSARELRAVPDKRLLVVQ